MYALCGVRRYYTRTITNNERCLQRACSMLKYNLIRFYIACAIHTLCNQWNLSMKICQFYHSV